MDDNYKNEIEMVTDFIIAHNYDIDFLTMLRECKESNYTLGEKWSKIYDYCNEYYPEATGTLITGLAYFC